MSVYRRMSHCVFLCDYHLVWPTKYRRKIFNGGVQGYLKEFLHSWPEHHPEIIIKEVNTDKDHIHFLVSIPPTKSVGVVVRTLKSVTASALNQQFPHLKKIYWGTNSIWSAGYFVSTVGVNEHIIRRYIQDQGETDTGHELRARLKPEIPRAEARGSFIYQFIPHILYKGSIDVSESDRIVLEHTT